MNNKTISKSICLKNRTKTALFPFYLMNISENEFVGNQGPVQKPFSTNKGYIFNPCSCFHSYRDGFNL